MLSVFPELLFLAPFSVFIIRIALGSVFIYATLQHIGNPANIIRLLGVVEGIIAAFVIAGAWTQAAALIAIGLISIWLFAPRFRTVALGTILLSLVLALTLVLSGAGPLAFDLPL